MLGAMRARAGLIGAGVVLLLGLLPGCGTTPHVTGAVAAALSPPTAQGLATRFPGAAGLLEGVDTADSISAWRTGDRVLLGLSFSRGTERTERMLLVELLEGPGRRARFRRKVGVFGDEIEINSPTRATRLRLFDAAGEELSDRRGQLAEIFLDYGPIEVARIGGGYAIATGADDSPRENPHPEVSLESLRPGVYGMMALLAFGDGASDNPTLAKLIEQAFTLGQKMNLFLTWGRFEIRFGGVERLAAGAEPVPGLVMGEAFDSEVRISIGRSEALSGRVVVVPTYAPLGLCGGVVAGELVNSADPTIRASLVLLGAIRGAEVTNDIPTNAKAGG
jgi:hypothetical protein